MYVKHGYRVGIQSSSTNALEVTFVRCYNIGHVRFHHRKLPRLQQNLFRHIPRGGIHGYRAEIWPSRATIKGIMAIFVILGVVAAILDLKKPPPVEFYSPYGNYYFRSK